MPRDRLKQSNSNSHKAPLAWMPGAMLPALVSGFVLQLFRVDQHRWVPAIWMEFAVLSVLSVAMFSFVKRWSKRSENSTASISNTYLAQAGAVIAVVLLIGWQLVSRRIGLGDANEIVALLAVQCVGWHLAVFASVKGFEKASLLLCGAIVFFVCCMTKRYDILGLGAIFAVMSLWWLAGIYWSRLDSKAIDGNAKMLQIHGASTSIGAVAIAIAVGVAMLSPFSPRQISIAGFMPFSGGEDGYQDPFATSGIGDGNMLSAGTNATTTGAVHSNEFIEDNKSSMYDVMMDSFDGPVYKKKKRNRTIALDEIAKHIHDVKQSEQSGRTFRTMRDTDKPADMELENRISKALFYVEGSVPARFVTDAFHHFDGWDWTKASLDSETPLPTKIRLQKQFGKPILKLSQSKSKYLTSSRSHQVKLMRLKTPNLPAPAFLDCWHINRVDDPRIFKWNEAGLVQYDGDNIPAQTVIDVNGLVPNYHVMRSGADLDPSSPNNRTSKSSNSDSVLLQTPDTSSRERVEALAAEYTKGHRPGWNQVEAIVNRIRQDFELNSDWEVDESADDTVSHFLSLNGGPSWMFASSCAMVLRSAGYRTRLASGFLVRKEDYDRPSRQSIVTSRNLHMWPEVCLDGKHWIPLEPTPGYPVPFSHEIAWQWFVAKVHGAISWFWNHPVSSLLIATAIVLTHLYRANLVTFLMLIWWHLIRFVWPWSLLRATRQLIDLRFWAAGDSRPLSKTIKAWYTRVEPSLSHGFYDLWNAQNYNSRHKVGNADLIEPCRDQINLLTLKKIQTFVSENSELETL